MEAITLPMLASTLLLRHDHTYRRMCHYDVLYVQERSYGVISSVLLD